MTPSLWTLEHTPPALMREFRFKDFNAAFGFMTQAALYAEQQGHHPDWSNSYNQVTVRLSTHTAKAITQKDTDFALFLNGLYD